MDKIFRFQPSGSNSELLNRFHCMDSCKVDDNCAGYFIKNSNCYTLPVANQFDLEDESGSSYYKKIKEDDFAKEALLQKPSELTCLLETNNAEGSCSYPYDYKGSKMYACIDGCGVHYR